VADGKDLPWLAVDIETPEKEKGVDESELALDDPSYIITRINFATSFDLDLGVTVPWIGPYINGIFKLLACKNLRISVWHRNYDIPRLKKNGAFIAEPVVDMMDGWHFLQSDVPKGLGFVSPLYSRYKFAWKHLSGTNPGVYAAWDGIQTIQDTVGVEKDLKANGQWHVFERHGPMLDRYALKPAEDVGLLFDKKEVKNFQEELSEQVAEHEKTIKDAVPDDLIPLEPKAGYKKRPLLENEQADPRFFQVTAKVECYKCLACNKIDVTVKHRCKERKDYEAEHNRKPFDFNEWSVTKWYRKGEFNPNSSQQILKYILFKGHKPGVAKKTKNKSADVSAIERLAKKHKKDIVYQNLLTLRKLAKVKSTYVDSALEHMDENCRVHTVFSNKPSTWRLASEVFNTTNVIASGKREDLGLGEKFRRCVVASSGSYLAEFDFNAIEAIQTGWYSSDPSYMRLASKSPHAFMTTHSKDFDGEPAQLDWPDDKLAEYLKWVKHEKKYKKLYEKNKRQIHGSSYGLTAKGLLLTYPELFASLKDAQATMDLFFGLFPKIKQFQNSVRKRAHEQMYLGGDDHPFKYKHWFFDVYTFKRINQQQAKQRQLLGDHCVEINRKWYAVYPGKDSKRCIAFYPQSTAGGVLREALLRLFVPGSPWYIGDVYYGKTPLRMPIHDSIVLEIPKSRLDKTIEKVYKAMTHPIIQQPCPDEWNQGEYLTKEQLDYLETTNQLTSPREIMESTKYLTIGVEAEVGTNWGGMEDLDLRRFE
jgi:DNA polymerase I-like protein with 3'-5' exonuclease and polymerase domains